MVRNKDNTKNIDTGGWGRRAAVSSKGFRSASPSSHSSPASAWIIFMAAVLQDTSATAWALHRLQPPSGYIHLLYHRVLHKLQGGYLLQHGLLWAVRGATCSTVVSSMSFKGISASEPGAPPPPLWPWCLQGCFSHFFISPFCYYCSFFNLFSQMHHPILSDRLNWAPWWLL